MQTAVEELAGNRVRLEVEVPREDVRHAVDHAASDLAQSLRIPGFRKGRVPLPVLVARVGRDRLYAEAVESHIGGWFRNAAVRTGIRPVAQPEYGYELPETPDEIFRFTATVPVQPPAELADWSTLEVPEPRVEVPGELIEQALDEVRASVAELVPVDGRGAADGDTAVLDVVAGEEAQRDYVVELGDGRMSPELEAGVIGMRPGEAKTVEYEGPDGERAAAEVTLRELKEKVLPELDDSLAQAASEFDTLAELRDDVEGRLREQLEREAEGAFRTAAADAVVEASSVEPADGLVRARASSLLRALAESLERRGLTLDTYLAISNQPPEQLEQQLLDEARRSIARELVLEAAAERLGIEVGDDEVEELVRDEVEAAGEDLEETLTVLRDSGRFEQLRGDLRLRRALDRIAAEVQRVDPEVAAARERLWTPEQEKTQADTKLWTPGSKETA